MRVHLGKARNGIQTSSVNSRLPVGRRDAVGGDNARNRIADDDYVFLDGLRAGFDWNDRYRGNDGFGAGGGG